MSSTFNDADFVLFNELNTQISYYRQDKKNVSSENVQCLVREVHEVYIYIHNIHIKHGLNNVVSR